MTGLETRLLDPERDQEGMIELFEEVFGFTVTPLMWAWKYVPPWTSRYYCWVAYSDDKPIGYCGAVPMRGQVRGREIAFFQLADFMVHPDYRRKYDYFELGAKYIIDEITKQPHLLYGFSDHRAFLWFKRLGMSDLIEKAVTRVIRPGQLEVESDRFEFRDWAWDEPEIDLLWARLGATQPIGLIRDAQYLGWRYGYHPAHGYRLLGVYEDGSALGWVLLGNDPPGENGRALETPVVDLLLPPERIQPVFSALTGSIDNSVMTWLPSRVAPGFPEEVETGTHVYHFKKQSTFQTSTLQDGLFYTMGDVDWW